MEKKFTMRDDDFVCDICSYQVPKLEKTARNHCPQCLTSKHVDNYPGDRMNDCGGVLYPIDVEKVKGDKYKIVFRCEKCQKIIKNLMADDDNFDLFLNIMQKKI